MSLKEVLDHLGEAKALLITQFQDKAALNDFLSTFITQIQELEVVWFDLLEERALATADGAQLDRLGEIVNLVRGGLTDTAYRIRLGFEIEILTSSGTVDQLLSVFGNIQGDEVIITEHPTAQNADFMLELQAPQSAADNTAFAVILQRMKAAGVRAVYIAPDAAFANPFFSFGPGPDVQGESAGFGAGAFVTSNAGD